MELCDKIREIRYVLRCTQKELAEKINVNKSRIISLENSHALKLTTTEAGALVELGFSRQWLLHNEGGMFSCESEINTSGRNIIKNSNDVHIRLKEIRTKLNILQVDFCKTLGLTQKHYSRYEAGVTGLPIIFLAHLIKEFNVNANWLLTGEGSMFIHERSDIVLLREIILGLERGLRSTEVNLSPESKAEFILLYYNEYLEQVGDNEEDDKIIRLNLAKDILRSIKTRNIK